MLGVGSAHLIGIGGAGMRNLARMLLARGVRVSGSDLKESRGLDELRVAGAQIWIGHDAGRLGDPRVVITSSAIGSANPELVAARERSIEIWARQQALVALAEGRSAIAVAGTHGKTTTTSMIAAILMGADLDASFLIGGDLNESGSGARSGDGDLFVFEADESDGSFLLAHPSIGVVTNVELDHVDFYPGGRDEIEAAFATFLDGCERAVVCRDDAGVRRALAPAHTDAITYGLDPEADVAVDVTSLGPGGGRGTVRMPDGEVVSLALRVDGTHNLLNAAAAVAVGALVGVDPALAAAAVSRFAGVHRRFELRGSVRGVDFYDDYGHTPTEMEVTLATARRRDPSRLVALVQPHRYTRVEAMWRELGASVSSADLIVVTDVFGAAQEPIPGVSGQLVADGVERADPDARVLYLPHRQEVLDYLERELRPGDLVVTMGCGDVWMLGDAAMARIRDADR